MLLENKASVTLIAFVQRRKREIPVAFVRGGETEAF